MSILPVSVHNHNNVSTLKDLIGTPECFKRSTKQASLMKDPLQENQLHCTIESITKYSVINIFNTFKSSSLAPKDIVKYEDLEGRTLLSTACSKGNNEATEYLLIQGGKELLAYIGLDNISALWGCLFNNHIHICYQLIHWDVNVNELEPELMEEDSPLFAGQRSPLEFAVISLSDRFVILLIKNGAKIQQYEKCCLHFSMPDKLQRLIQISQDIHKRTALIFSALDEFAFPDVLKAIVDKYDLD